MRTTITLDDELLAKAHEMTGVAERSTLIHNGLRLLIQHEAARRLAALGGSDPAASIPPRRRSSPAAAAPAPAPLPRKRGTSK
ncbi:MAG TPA: type II toxin-antitoxin system VapB family antitoxin [Rubrivivax sp.]|nr:type II toxin-antitoxin system VapB family antitoxin [Rubrivivax sp.]